jgi:hypothetical protein
MTTKRRPYRMQYGVIADTVAANKQGELPQEYTPAAATEA